MWKAPIVAVLFALCACSHGGLAAPHKGVTNTSLACPSLQPSLGYKVSVRSGPESITCTLAPRHAGELPAVVYVGDSPPPQPRLRFVGFTPSIVGSNVWFSSAAGGKTRWVTYLPTGRLFPSVIMLSVESGTAPSLFQLGIVANVVAGASPEISFKRKR